MDTQVISYTFDKSAKTITFTDYATIRLDSIRLVINVEDNIVLYNPAKANTGGSVLNNVLTLDYDTSAMSNTDKLQIIYNNEDLKASQALQQDIVDLMEAVHTLAHRLEALASVMNAGAPALRVIPIASVSTAVTGTVAVSAVTLMGGQNANVLAWGQTNLTGVMSNIINVAT